MKVGDLIELRPFCKDRDRLAIIVGIKNERFFNIMFVDTEEMSRHAALKSNAIMVSESREIINEPKESEKNLNKVEVPASNRVRDKTGNDSHKKRRA